jgi:hypothetical protein
VHKGFGLPLSSIAGFSGEIREKLQALHLTTAEELVALAAIDGAKQGLSAHLRISEDQLAGHIGTAKQYLSSHVISAMEGPYNRQHSLGAVQPPAGHDASVKPGPYESTMGPAPLPASVNLVSRFRPVKNQGGRGTCVTFSCTALNEDWHRYLPGGCPDLSEQDLYYECKQNDGNPNGEGSFVKWAMYCLVQFGQCTAACWPYNPNPPTNQPGPPPPCAAPERPNYKLPDSQQLNANSDNDIKGALADGKPVPFSIPVYNSWYQSAAVETSGNITMPLPGEAQAGGHSMLFVGYQDDSSTPGGGYFILRNSWGVTWGSESNYGQGYGAIPYQYMTDNGWEAYTYQTLSVPPSPVSNSRGVRHYILSI